MQCECDYPNCMAHPNGRRYPDGRCPQMATMIVTRLRGDFEGSIRRFCSPCAMDATTGDDAFEFASAPVLR